MEIELTERQAALVALLERPDPPDLAGKRVHRYVFTEPEYDADEMTRWLALRWLAYHEHDTDPDDPRTGTRKIHWVAYRMSRVQ